MFGLEMWLFFLKKNTTLLKYKSHFIKTKKNIFFMWIPSKKVNHAFKPNILYLFWRLKLSFMYEPAKKNRKKKLCIIGFYPT